jgi:hypothetical protein
MLSDLRWETVSCCFQANKMPWQQLVVALSLPGCLVRVIDDYAQLTFEECLNVCFPEGWSAIPARDRKDGHFTLQRLRNAVECSVEYYTLDFPPPSKRLCSRSISVPWPHFVRAAQTRTLLSLFYGITEPPNPNPDFDHSLHEMCARGS